MKFTLAQISCFIAVAENLHFGRAAEELNMTQPPLSRQIQKLEKSIGVPLFERNNRNVTLTPAGEVFLSEAYVLINAADRAPRMAQNIAQGSWGQIRIGCTSISTFGALGSIVSTIAEHAPGVSIEIEEMVTAEQIKALTEGRLDLGLGRALQFSDEIDSTVIRSERLVLAVPDTHDFAARTTVSTDEIVGQTLLMHDRIKARYFYDLVTKHINVEANEVAHTLSQIVTIINLVAAGRGIAVVAESAARLGVDGVTYLALRGVPDNIVELHAFWDPCSRNPALTTVLELVRESSRPQKR